MTLGDIASATGGTLAGPCDPSALVQGMTWDSREVTPGCLYVAFPGERVDGHDFAQAAFEAGAACLLLQRELPCPCPQVVVEDTQAALGRLAEAWRRRIPAKVVAITGSTGKTSTKALVRDVLSAAGEVVATKANQNNEIGVPNTLLSATDRTEFIVVEMGMRGPGQIDALCAVAQPDWGLITNVGESHMELLGTRENIAKAKAELFCNLPQGGIAFVNADDPYAGFVREEAELAGRGVAVALFSAMGEPCAPAALKVWAQDVALNAAGQPGFTLCCRWADGLPDAFEGRFCRAADDPAEAVAASQPEAKAEKASGSPSAQRQPHAVPCQLQVRGIHNVSNACSAAAVGLAAGLTLSQCADALGASLPESGRQEFLACGNGAILINDAYNANPDSMAAALESLAMLDIPGRRAAVLGDMGELGPIEVEAHGRVGAKAAESNLDLLVCVGELSRHMAEAARRQGMDRSSIVEAESLQEALDAVRHWVRPDDAVLVKASHFMAFEKIVEGLVG